MKLTSSHNICNINFSNQIMAATNGNDSWVSFTIKCPPLDDCVEEIYEDLCYVTFSSSLPEVQILVSSCL